jgi:hypothetical protein|tara:strand:+ start:1256 stop:1816 length:561 start_codon:yes stop_codon:yes gene_type:complete
MARVKGQLDAPVLDIGTVREDYWERKEILLPSLARLYEPKGWRKWFYKTQSPKIVLKRLTQSDWEEIDNKNAHLMAELGSEQATIKPLMEKYLNGKDLTDKESIALHDYSKRMRPVTYNMLQHIIDEPVMSYEEVNMMMEIIDQVDSTTLMSYVSLMTSEKANVMKHLYAKQQEELGAGGFDNLYG